MKKFFYLLGVLLGLSACQSTQSAVDFSTVVHFDLEKFMGKWYEIARYDHRFERGMTDVTATYTLKADGTISVLNEGVKDGEHKRAEGRGRQPDVSAPGKLKVAFFLWFYADYYVLDVDADYRYALVGSSTDKYLWILSREKHLPEDVRKQLLEKLEGRGYDTSKLIFVDHS